MSQEGEGVGEVVVSNGTEESNDTVVVPLVPPPQEDIPSFSEWAQKQLAEAEKRKGKLIALDHNQSQTSCFNK